MANAPKSFAAQAKAYFGYLPGQSLQDFGRELRQLTPDDKDELSQALTSEGFPVVVEAPKGD